MEERSVRIIKQSDGVYLNKDDLIYNLSIKSSAASSAECRVVILAFIKYLALIQE